MNEFYISKDFDSSKPIYRYMPLVRFIEMLETNKLFVAQRKDFEDKMESELNLKNQFAIRAVGQNIPEQKILSADEEIKRISNKIKQHRKYSSLTASCWTQQATEDILMWESYSKRIGVRIESNANDFVSAIDTQITNVYVQQLTIKLIIISYPQKIFYLLSIRLLKENRKCDFIL